MSETPENGFRAGFASGIKRAEMAVMVETFGKALYNLFLFMYNKRW